MGLTEVSQGDGSIYSRNDLGKTNICRGLCEDVPAANAAFGTHKAGAFQSKKNLLEVRLGETGSVCNVANRGRRACFCV
jgi:hypothetical protein